MELREHLARRVGVQKTARELLEHNPLPTPASNATVTAYSEEVRAYLRALQKQAGADNEDAVYVRLFVRLVTQWMQAFKERATQGGSVARMRRTTSASTRTRRTASVDVPVPAASDTVKYAFEVLNVDQLQSTIETLQNTNPEKLARFIAHMETVCPQSVTRNDDHEIALDMNALSAEHLVALSEYLHAS